MSNNHDLTFKDRGHPLMVLAASTSAPVGGQNVLQSTLQYGYEQFLEQINLAEQLTSSDLFWCFYRFNQSKLLGKYQMVL